MRPLIFALILTAAFIPLTSRAQSTESVIYNFTPDYAFPAAGLVADPSGNLYGTTIGGTASPNGAVFRLSPSANGTGAWTRTVLFNFNYTNGSMPLSPLTLDTQGNLYGSAYYGGKGQCSNGNNMVAGCGVIFKLLRPTTSHGAWKQVILYDFHGYVSGGSDGANPMGKLLFDAQGNLWGTTQYGGYIGCEGNTGCGMVFELSPPTQSGSTWTEHEILLFDGPDGAFPTSLVLQPKAVFGIAMSGGQYGNGLVFMLRQEDGNWTYSNLYEFTNGADGGNPVGGIISDGLGGFYGTTNAGGAYSLGTVFQVSPSAIGPWKENVLHDFSGGADGAHPLSPLIRTQSQVLYGTTLQGGSDSDVGVIFRLSPPSTQGDPWTENILHSFGSFATDGNTPAYSSAIFGKSGKLYGTTEVGGSEACVRDGVTSGCGTVYAITPGAR